METTTLPLAQNLGFKAAYSPMSETMTKLFIISIISSEDDIKSRFGEEIPFPIAILNKRIEAMQLPITFTLSGNLAALAVTEGNPGRMMTLLIDCLTKHEGEDINAEIIAEMYPFGFYSEESFINLVDNYIKPKKIKWSDIY